MFMFSLIVLVLVCLVYVSVILDNLYNKNKLLLK